ncbi:uncharacterized protein JCM15063_001313 [Sporobolomyces koalae]|uniref:uncharacterized protein n=1 Tax=Sporobolomyces koalae TaxID=500713 RepID=UPI00317FEEF5
MPPRKSVGSNKSTPEKVREQAPELNETPARFDLPRGDADQNLALAPVDQQKAVYQPGAPIKFFDEEVNRMHVALEQKAEDERRAARRALRQPPRPRRGITLTGFLTRVAIVYIAIAYLLVCPHDSTRERAVCRRLDDVSNRLRLYEPAVRPYYRKAHRRLDPYIRRTRTAAQPYVDRVKPHYSRVAQTVSPAINRAYRFYLDQVYPRLVASVKSVQQRTKPFSHKLAKQYRKTLAPSVDWYSESLRKWYIARVEPKLDQFVIAARQYAATVSSTISPVYTRGVPLAQHHYYTHLVPFSRSTYSTTRDTYFSHVHPRVATTSTGLVKLYKTRVAPPLLRFWSKFIAPQLDKIRERIFEFKAKEARVAATKRVEKVSDDLAQQHGEADFADYVKELRDDTYVGQTADPVVVQEQTSAPRVYSTSIPPPPPSREEQAALTAEKRAALETLQSTYEREIAALGRTEQTLLIQRLAELRQQALDDIPARFDPVLESLDEEGDKMVGKLGRYFSKASADEKTSVEAKVAASDRLNEQARVKVDAMKVKIEEEMRQYRAGLVTREEKAVDEAKKSVSTLVAKAQEELGFGWTWLDDVTHKDWQRYHGLRKAEENLFKSFSDLQSGGIRDSTLSALHPDALLNKYAEQPAALVQAFLSVLAKITNKGQKEIKGDWTGAASEAQRAYAAVGDKVAAMTERVKEQASSVAGVEPQPTNLRETMAAMATSAQLSASSLASVARQAMPTIDTPHSSANFRQSAGFVVSEAQLKAAEAVARASQEALRAVGIQPSPTDLSQSAESVARAVQSSAASIVSTVVTDVPASISTAINHAAETASSLASSVSSLAAPHSSFATAVPASIRLGSAAREAQEQIRSAVGDISQGAIRALGGEPKPTDLHQTATSLASAVSKSLSSASSVASSLAQPHSDFAKSAVVPSSASGRGVRASMESLASSVSSAVHDATRTTAEGLRETAASLSSVAAESLQSINAPHSSYSKSIAAASVKRAMDEATGVIASATAQAKSVAHEARESAKSALHIEL